MINTSV